MIAKLHYDSSFDRLCAYVTQQAGKQAEVLAANGVRVSSAGEMAADFELQRSTRPGLEQAVEHISLAWPPGETAKLTNEVMTRAALLFMEKRGIDPAQTQWVLARHYDEDHPHCHLLLNRVTDTGGVVPDKFSHLRSAKACRQVEQEMGFVDAAQLGAAKTLARAEKAVPQVSDVVERLRLKALVAQALEKHLPTVTTMTGLQEALAGEHISLKTILQKEEVQGVIFTANAYPGLHMKGSEVARQYSGGQLRQTLEAQAQQAQQLRQEREAREAAQREAAQQQERVQQAQLAEARLQARLREMLLAALDRQVPGKTSLAELQSGLAAEGVSARPSWQADGQLREISFTAAVFPGREISGMALGTPYEATDLSQTLAGQAEQQAAEQREAAVLRQHLVAQAQQLAELREAARQAGYRSDYGKVADLTASQLSAAETRLIGYQEQARATAAGQVVLQELAAAEKERTAAREQRQQACQQALQQTLDEGRGKKQEWPAYQTCVQQLGFDLLEINGQLREVQHRASGEKFDLTLVQPGGADAPGLQQRVQWELDDQENAGLRAKDVLVRLLATRKFASDSELNQHLGELAYRRLVQPDGQVWLHHEPSGRRFALAELQANGQPLETRLQAAMASRQAELRRGQLEVGPGPDGPAAERAVRFQRLLEAAGAQVSAGAGPAATGRVVLEYRYEWNGAQLEAVNQALRQVQAAAGTLVREQRGEVDQPEAAWPVRAGEYGRATVLVGDSDKRSAAERVMDVTRMLQEKGAWVTEVRSPGSRTVELEVGYQTQQPDFPALSRLLDKCNETPAVEMRETAYACLVRGEMRQPETGAVSAPEKAITSPAPVEQQPVQDYEYDDD